MSAPQKESVMDSRQQEQHPPATGDDESYISAPSESTENVAEPSTSTAVAPSLGPVGLGPDDVREPLTCCRRRRILILV